VGTNPELMPTGVGQEPMDLLLADDAALKYEAARRDMEEVQKALQHHIEAMSIKVYAPLIQKAEKAMEWQASRLRAYARQELDARGSAGGTTHISYADLKMTKAGDGFNFKIVPLDLDTFLMRWRVSKMEEETNENTGRTEAL